jgi:diguanylate cyclase (GGDEF)-like protein
MDQGPSFALAETRRLAALHALDLLDTAPEQDFDALVRLAAAVTGCPTAFVALIDAKRMWVKAGVGAVPAVVPRPDALCDTIIRTDAPLVVGDLAADPGFRDHWIVAAGSRFCAGLPIRAADIEGAARPVGTLCVLDPLPRGLDAGQQRALADLARLAEALIVSRRAAREALAHAAALERQHRLFAQAERMARIGSWRLTLDDEHVEWSEGIIRIHDLPGGRTPSLATALDFYPPAARAAVSAALARTIETGEPFDLEVDFISASGRQLRVRSAGELERDEGNPRAIVGVFRDVTEEHAFTEALRRSADTDPLTLIANRTAFERRLEQATGGKAPFALALIDLDGFKRVNDTLGHLAGDDLLKAVARRLHAPWLKGSLAARLGGDEFAVVIDDPALLAAEDKLVARLEDELCVSTTHAGLTMETGSSVGLVRFDRARHGSTRDLVQAADEALYIAKRSRVGERRRR